MNADIDLSNVTLRTERLVLRPWRADDLEDLFEYASVDGVGQMAGWAPHRSIEETKGILDMFIRETVTFAVEYKGKAIGSLGVDCYDEELYPEFFEKRCREIGYVLSKDYWGKGLMPEAVSEVLRYLFEDMGLDAVFCSHYLWNTQSDRVQDKCGFRHFGYADRKTRMGTVEKSELKIMTKEEWIADHERA